MPDNISAIETRRKEWQEIYSKINKRKDKFVTTSSEEVKEIIS
jgi:hypothetical protein